MLLEALHGADELGELCEEVVAAHHALGGAVLVVVQDEERRQPHVVHQQRHARALLSLFGVWVQGVGLRG